MKMYVHGYWPRGTESEPQKRPFAHIENTEVAFSVAPAWKIATLPVAQRECEILQGLHVRVGYHHSCEFSVEELPEGEFAIVCFSQPESVQLAAKVLK
jgi:hypothetical protein